MRALHVVTALLVIIGGLNWGLVALAEYDLVAALFADGFGTTNAFTRVVYGLVGLSAVYQLLVLLGAVPATSERVSHA